MTRLVPCLLLLAAGLPALAADPPAPRAVDVAAPDGVKLKATYYPAAQPGPGVLLLHMCNSSRQAWDVVGKQLAAVGIHALALDYRGYGESGGERFQDDPQKQQQVVNQKWPGDVDAAFAVLVQQPGVDGKRVGAGGGSCGVNQAVQAASRHPEVRALVLLAGGTDGRGRTYLQKNGWLPVFAAAAADDQFDRDALRSMQWLADLSGNPRSRFVGFADGKHGTEIFGPHPELPRQIVDWYVDTLVKAPVDPKSPPALRKTPAAEFLAALDAPGGVAKARQQFVEARRRDPQAYLFPEGMMNLLGYERLQAGQMQDAIELFKMNAEAYPTSANTYDSLGDAYVAAGQNEDARKASEKCLELLPADKLDDAAKKAIRQSAEQKLEKLKPAPAK
ncbi:MAG TPA: alpha/beta hydrolase [Vicinamibacteria bacterium]